MKIAPVDYDILRCLQGNARTSIAKIAARLKMPESTVGHRLNRLIDAKVVEFAPVIDPLRFGYQIWALIEVQAELSSVRAVANRLAQAPEATFVAITTGGYDVLVAAIFRSNRELLDFITNKLSRVPGIIRTTTSSVVELVKRTTFGLPEEQLGMDHRPPRRTGVRRGRRGKRDAVRPE